MELYDIYGILSVDLHRIADQLAELLDIEWVARESSYIGDYYKWGAVGGENFVLQRNFLAHEQEWMLPDQKQYQVLLYVNNTKRSKAIEDIIIGSSIPCTLLDRQTAGDLDGLCKKP